MAITQLYNSSATIGATEYSLTTNSTTLGNIATDGVYQVFIDFVNLTATEEYEIAIKETVNTTQRIIFKATVAGVQGSPIWVSPSLILMTGWDVTVKKMAGTDRTILWCIRQVA